VKIHAAVASIPWAQGAGGGAQVVVVARTSSALRALRPAPQLRLNWNAAVSLYPPIARSDMSAYGAAGTFLKEHPPAPIDVRVPEGARIVPPSAIKRVEPKYASRSLTSEVEGVAVFEFLVGRDGRAHTPRVVDDAGAPILAFATPATADGQPVDAPFRLTMKHKVLR